MSDRARVSLIYARDGEPAGRILRGMAEIAIPAGWLFQPFSEEDPMITFESAMAWESDVVVMWYPDPVRLPTALNPQAVISLEADRTALGIGSVILDDDAIGTLAAQHLRERGIKHFAAFGHDQYAFSSQRNTAFRRAVEQAGGVYHDGQSILKESEMQLDGHLKWQRQLQRLPKPLGVFSPCDAWAGQVIRICQMNGLVVPEQVAVVGACDDRVYCEICEPRLSSVPVPWEKLGRAAGELVSQRLAGKRSAASIRIAPEAVVVRGSSDILVDASPEVRRALSYIAGHACQAITTDHVVDHVLTSRRALEQEFRRYLKRSIAQEIRRTRVERAKQLLATTRAPVADIAHQVGFESPGSFYEAFARETAMTPNAYRHSHIPE